jgi:hypothetical protein
MSPPLASAEALNAALTRLPALAVSLGGILLVLVSVRFLL